VIEETQRTLLSARRHDMDDRVEIRCLSCGYGAVVAHFPERCPMCGGGLWNERDIAEPKTRREEQVMSWTQLDESGDER